MFCTVIAVMAVMPYTPSALNVLRSAWMPAPPPESDPAIVSARGRGGVTWLAVIGSGPSRVGASGRSVPSASTAVRPPPSTIRPISVSGTPNASFSSVRAASTAASSGSVASSS